MNRKILVSSFSALTALTLLTASAFAAFTTTASATGSTFSTGTDNLLISKDNGAGSYFSSISSPFIGSNLTPGTVKHYIFYLKNDNTNSTDDLTVTAGFTGGTPNVDLDNALSTQFSCTDVVTTTPPAYNVTDMRSGSVPLGIVKSGHVATCTLDVTLPGSADNTLKGLNTTFNVNFNGTEVTPS